MTPPYPPPIRPDWRRRVRDVTTERLGLKAIAIVLALLLWIVVSLREPTEGYVSVRVAPVLDSSLVLIGRAPQVQALVSGRAADLAKLYANPLVLRRTVSGDVPDTLMLDLTPADVHVPAELSEVVHVLDVQPRAVMLRFESSVTRRVPVRNEGRVVVHADSVPAAGMTLAEDLVFDPDWVRVTGPRRVVRQLHGIHPDPLSIAWGDTLPHVADLDTTGIGVRVEPAQVKVRNRAPVDRVAPPESASPSAPTP
ncbi:MAG TPA: hypothetical protein VF461_19075 [Gemmatimonadaceae bacterium]